MRGASRDLSPRTILTGQKVDYKRHCRFQFGEYAQTHEEHNNSMNPRTVGALALQPVGNGQGSFYFLSVATGRVLNRLHATALPMPDDIIDQIHRMARQQKNNPGLIFADRNLNPDEGEEDDDDDDDMTYHDDDNDNDDDDDDEPHDHNNNNNDDDESSHNSSDNNDDDEENNNVDDGPLDDDDSVENNDGDASDGIENDAPEEDEEQENEPPPVDNPPLDDVAGHYDDPPGEIPGVGVVEQESKDDGGHLVDGNDCGDELGIPGVGDDEEDDTNDEQSETTLDLKTNTVGGYGLRNKRDRNYNHHYAGEDFVVGNDTGITLATKGNDVVLETPQMSLKAGLRTFGKDGMKALEKEMRQLHDHDVMKPVYKKSLTQEQRKQALAYLMSLKRKRCGKIKGRGCADGRKQRAYITKEDSTAPMVSTEAVFLTAVIDAMEGRNVVVLDVPGAFMQAEIDELVHVRFTGAMVTLLLEIDHEMYKDYVVV